MNPQTQDSIQVFWEVFGLPLLAVLLILIGYAVLSAWVDYQIRKEARNGRYH